MDQMGGSQGYIVLATGSRKYLVMATNLVASILVMDPNREVCVVHDPDADVPRELQHSRVHLRALPPDPLYPTVINKFRLPSVSPFGQTMYVDADCLLVKRDIDFYWNAVGAQPLSITGSRRVDGLWKGRRIRDILREQNVDHIVQNNGGVFTFNTSPESVALFEDLNAFYLERRESLRVHTHQGTRFFSDEMYFAVFMGLRNIPPASYDPGPNNSWMVTTWRALACRFDPRSELSVIYKARSNLFDLTIMPTGWRRLSPTFAHFVGLKPRRLYTRLANEFRVACGMPLLD